VTLTCHESLVGADARPALVVDDDREVRGVLSDFLRLCGLSVLEARNGLEALLSVRQHRPEVVVLDLNMPRLGGLEALKRIHPFDPTIRVAVVTEDPDAKIHQRARALGATVVLTKPVDLGQLGTALGLTPADRQPIASVPRSASLSPEGPPRPSAARILMDDDAWSRGHAPDFAPAVGLDAGLDLRAPLRVDGADGQGRAGLDGPRTRGGAQDVSPADLPRGGEVVRGETHEEDAGQEGEVAGVEEDPPHSEPGGTALQSGGGEPPAGLVKDDAGVRLVSSRPGRGEGEPTRGLAWLLGVVRALFGAGPAREGAQAEPEQESPAQPAPGVDGPLPSDARHPGASPPRAGAGGPADASPAATTALERLREEFNEPKFDEPIPGRKTMSYYGILGLTKEPFSTSPDPAFFYESASHKAVLYRLQIAIKLKRGLSLVLGDVGMGKTTLSRRLVQLLKREEQVASHLILNPVYDTEAEFLTALVKLFGITVPSGPLPVARSLEILEGYLFEKGVEQERTVVLLIDEAQRLSSSSLELLRALLNYETNEYKLLQLILMGQMELLPRIREMKNLWDRISLKGVIDPLDEADTEAMIAFRLRMAGYTARRNLFTPEAMAEIYRHSQGSPRRITTLCHDALEQLVISDKNEVDEAIVRRLVKQVLA
jgi:type II secretory pathway predicted ATPase ExeA/ActR/RegA family two-component response regulator